MEFDKNTDMVLYMRDNKNTPVGVIYAKKDTSIYDDVLVTLGWSKFNKNFGKFDKARGRDIAKVRCDRAYTYASSIPILNTGILLDLNTPLINGLNIPYIFQSNFIKYIDKIRETLNIEESAIYILPIVSNDTILDAAVLNGKTPIRYNRTSYFKFNY